MHVAINPATGVLSVIQELVREQVRSGMAVGIGVITTKNLPNQDYAEQCDPGITSLDIWRSNSRYGVLACLVGGLGRNVVDKWVSKLQQTDRVSKVVVHYHCSFLATLLAHARVQNGAIVTFHGVRRSLQSHFSETL